MNNEFGYTYNKPFIDIDKNKQLHTIINIKDDCIELKINDVNTFIYFLQWMENQLILILYT